MVFGWFRRRRRRRYLREQTPPDWAPHLEAMPFVQRLSEDEVQRLVALARAFEQETSFEGCGGLKVTEVMLRSICLQACRLILNLDLDGYRKVRSVLIYPAAFVAEASQGTLKAMGLAVLNGPVILAWNHVRRGARSDKDGMNVVYHEFAHKLDMLDGFVDGIPPMASDREYRAWKELVGKGHRRLRISASRGRQTLINSYGGTNEAEFFAVSTEIFFEKPVQLRRRHKLLYRSLATFYRQDPAHR